MSLDDVGIRLRDATFVIIDLETTGGSPALAGITEIGAVKVRGGMVIGEFATLVNPGEPIPAYIAVLTGITDGLVAAAPPLPSVLGGLLEFISGAILVAHNAPYDVGFLKGACARYGYSWPSPRVLDTARLARVCLHRDEVRNCKLATLAAHFRAQHRPTHRALDDARATTEVFHALLERAANFGVTTVDDAVAFTSRVSPQQRTKRTLADGLPESPGVYVFADQQGTALYVGRSRNIKRRVRTYFTASETRRRITEMIAIASSVQPIVCATELEAQVREVRLIASAQPRYNQASKHPHSQVWLVLTPGHAARLSIVRRVTSDHLAYLGPFSGRQQAQVVADAIALTFGLRTCSRRIPKRSRNDEAGCLAADLAQCLAPCRPDDQSGRYASATEAARLALQGEGNPVFDALHARMVAASQQSRYEEAAAWRDRLSCVAQSSLRSHRRRSLARCAQLVAARPTSDGGWEAHCIRFGVLAGAVVIPAGGNPKHAIEALISSAAAIEPPEVEITAGLDEEARLILDWLDSPGVRLVVASTPLSMPIGCGGALASRLADITGHSAVERHWSAGQRPLGPPIKPVSRLRDVG